MNFIPKSEYRELLPDGQVEKDDKTFVYEQDVCADDESSRSGVIELPLIDLSENLAVSEISSEWTPNNDSMDVNVTWMKDLVDLLMRGVRLSSETASKSCDCSELVKTISNLIGEKVYGSKEMSSVLQQIIDILARSEETVELAFDLFACQRLMRFKEISEHDSRLNIAERNKRTENFNAESLNKVMDVGEMEKNINHFNEWDVSETTFRNTSINSSVARPAQKHQKYKDSKNKFNLNANKSYVDETDLDKNEITEHKKIDSNRNSNNKLSNMTCKSNDLGWYSMLGKSLLSTNGGTKQAVFKNLNSSSKGEKYSEKDNNLTLIPHLASEHSNKTQDKQKLLPNLSSKTEMKSSIKEICHTKIIAKNTPHKKPDTSTKNTKASSGSSKIADFINNCHNILVTNSGFRSAEKQTPTTDKIGDTSDTPINCELQTASSNRAQMKENPSITATPKIPLDSKTSPGHPKVVAETASNASSNRRTSPRPNRGQPNMVRADSWLHQFYRIVRLQQSEMLLVRQIEQKTFFHLLDLELHVREARDLCSRLLNVTAGGGGRVTLDRLEYTMGVSNDFFRKIDALWTDLRRDIGELTSLTKRTYASLDEGIEELAKKISLSQGT